MVESLCLVGFIFVFFFCIFAEKRAGRVGEARKQCRG